MSALSAIHAGRRQLGIVEDDARDIYERVTGKRSLREMKPVELDSVVRELRRLGFKQDLKPSRKRLEGKFAPKLQALWIAGWNLGLVRDRRDDALITFVKRQSGVDHARFLHHSEDANRVIEALKGWLARGAGVDWQSDRLAPTWKRTDGYRIVIAQLRLVTGNPRPCLAEWYAANHQHLPPLPLSPGLFVNSDWHAIMNHLGEMVRKSKSGGK